MPDARETPAPPAGFPEAMERMMPELDLTEARGTTALAAWFLGPRGENRPFFEDLIAEAVRSHCEDRRTVYPEDPVYVTDAMKQTDVYDRSVRRIGEEYRLLLDRLFGSVPQFSYRYQGHMLWDLTIPGMLGYFAGMLYNQNNIAAESSPVTTMLEAAVGTDLCRMLGYRVDVEEDPRPWAPLTCDGTVANLEAMWSARNLTYFPVSVARALANESALAKARDLTVMDGAGQPRRLLDLTDWALVNLPMDAVLAITGVLEHVYGLDREAISRINAYTLQELGFERFHRDMLDQRLGPPAVLAPSTMHYSWPKAAAVLGIGQDNVLTVHVDREARASVRHRKELLRRCKKEMRPVVMDVAVLGSTELSAVDPLAAILRLRKENARDGLCYPVHVDAAWGGYFAALRRRPAAGRPLPEGAFARATVTPSLMMSEYVNRQYDALAGADSVTIDPHKAGYIPYPAGALCYRNKRQRDMVTFLAPYVFQPSAVDPSVGPYSIEGSKPGASAAAVYLSHRVIRPDQSGYGRILGQSLFSSKRLYSGIVTMDRGPVGARRTYRVVPVQWLPAERAGGDEDAVNAQLDTIHERIVQQSNEDLVKDEKAMRLFAELGSDQVIIGYAFNPYVGTELNREVALANRVNQRIYDMLSPRIDAMARAEAPKPREVPPMILMRSVLDPQMYGAEFVASFARRMGLAVPDEGSTEDMPSLVYLISTTMDPWMTDTAAGDFTPELIRILDQTARTAIADVLTPQAADETAGTPARASRQSTA